MKQISEIVRRFFEDYEKSNNAADLDILAMQYSDSFMFASPEGIQAVKRDDFLKVIPKRKEFFKTVGLAASKIQSLEETRLDKSYIMVKVHWSMQFKKDSTQLIVDEISATYILHQQEQTLQIVFQLDHQNLMKRVQDLGLLPAND